MFTQCRLSMGEALLVHGAAGGVGTRRGAARSGGRGEGHPHGAPAFAGRGARAGRRHLPLSDVAAAYAAFAAGGKFGKIVLLMDV